MKLHLLQQPLQQLLQRLAVWLLAFGISSIRSQKRAYDATTIINLIEKNIDNERLFAEALRKISLDVNDDWLLSNHFNYLEIILCLYNQNLVEKHSRKFCKDVAIQHLAAIQINKNACSILERSVVNADTFEEISRFYRKYKSDINTIASLP